jgi:hypothetical protein
MLLGVGQMVHLIVVTLEIVKLEGRWLALQLLGVEFGENPILLSVGHEWH